MTPTEALILLIPLAPLAAAVVTLLLPASQVSRPAILGCLLSFAAATVLMMSLVATASPAAAAADTSSFAVNLGNWIAVEGDPSLRVPAGLEIDLLSAALLMTVTLATGCVVAHTAMDMPRANCESDHRRFFFGTAFLLFATTMVLLSGNLLELFVFWQLASLGVYWLSGIGASQTTSAVAGRKVFLTNRISDAALILAVLLSWIGFGALDFSEILAPSGRLSVLLDENPAMLTLACLCLLVAATTRCAQFPLMAWLDDAARMVVPVQALVQAACLMPAGVYLVLRYGFLFHTSPGAELMMAFLGGTTSLLAAAIAAAVSDWKQMLAYSSASLYGMVFLGLGTGCGEGVSAAVVLLVAHCLVKTSLFLGIEQASVDTGPRRGVEETRGGRATSSFVPWLLLGGCVILASGLWGQNSILAATWDASVEWTSPPSAGADPNLTLFAVPPARLYQVLFFVALGSVSLLALAMFRGWLLHSSELTRADNTHNELGPRSPLRFAPIIVPIAVVTLLVPLAVARPDWFSDTDLPGRTTNNADHTFTWQPFAAPYGLLAALLGAALAWLNSRIPASGSSRLGSFVGPLVAAARNRFYFDDVIFLGVTLPVRGLAQLGRFFDWFVVDGLLVDLPARCPALVRKAAAPLQDGLVQFYALSIVLAAAVVFVVLLVLAG